MAADPCRPLSDATIRATAAYFGDALVRSQRGEWTLKPGDETALLIIVPEGVPVINMVAVVRWRVQEGPPDGLRGLLELCLSGRTSPPLT
ncbi:MAG: hypothetical protein M3137_17080 [Actinomycetota bacterium]|nr:hypothetical protein [Actinomycetota bacterium]